MALIVDAGVVVALHDRRDPQHEVVTRLLQEEPEELVVPAPVTAEIDYLLGRRTGPQSRRAFVADLAAGRYLVECLRPDEYRLVAQLERQYTSLSPGLADLSIVVIADRLQTRRIATFDERHFRAMRALDGGAFALLPADAPA